MNFASIFLIKHSTLSYEIKVTVCIKLRQIIVVRLTEQMILDVWCILDVHAPTVVYLQRFFVLQNSLDDRLSVRSYPFKKEEKNHLGNL